jgi:hypothetical protein
MSLTHAARDPQTTNSHGDGPAIQAAKVRDLFPDLSDSELREIGETLNRYYAVVLRVYGRLRQENPEIIDELMKNRRMEGKVDSLK